MSARTWLCGLLAVALVGCGGSEGDGGSDGGAAGGDARPPSASGDASIPAGGVGGACGSVRMTQYGSSDRRWCGFDRTHPALPSFVREGMTIAIAEPYNGSSFEGDPGEACGECWEISTTFGQTLVMVHDLCPIEGNPICAGSHFHFDVSNEVAAVLDGGQWLGEGAVRRVPCPVEGDIYVHVTARNAYGYLQLAFFNHREPIRRVEYRAVGGEAWRPMERCLARWCLDGDTETFAEGSPGGHFRFTSAAGEVVEATQPLTYDVAEDDDLALGVQFADPGAPAPACEFAPPGEVYRDAWGGIDGVQWMSNTWGGAHLEEISEGCAAGSAACLRLSPFQDAGLHLTYRHTFPKATFSTLRLQLKGAVGVEVRVAPRAEEGRCEGSTMVTLLEGWTPVEIDVAASCPGVEMLHGLTISHADVAELGVDEVIFE